MNSEKITSRQLILLITTFGLSVTISYMFALNLPPSNQDVWIMILLSFVYSLIFRIPLLFLNNKFPELTLVEMLEKILGKFAGKFFGLFYALYFMAYTIFILILQTQMTGINILASTPNWLIIGLTTIACLYIGSKDLVMMCWTGELVTSISLFSIVLLILLGLKNVNFTLLLPILSDSTFAEINKGAIMFSFLTTDVFVLIKASPFLENKKNVYKIFVYSSLFFTIICAIAVAVTQGALGLEQARHTIYPFLIYTRIINFTAAFERIDVVFVTTWIAINTGRVAFFMYFGYMALKDVFNIDKSKVIFIVIGILIGIISIYIANNMTIVVAQSMINLALMLSTAIFVTIIPLIAMIVYFFRRRSLDTEKLSEN